MSGGRAWTLHSGREPPVTRQRCGCDAGGDGAPQLDEAQPCLFCLQNHARVAASSEPRNAIESEARNTRQRSARLPFAHALLHRLRGMCAVAFVVSIRMKGGRGRRLRVHTQTFQRRRTCSIASRMRGLACARASSSARRSRMMAAYSSMAAVAASQELRSVTSSHGALLFAFLALLLHRGDTRARPSARASQNGVRTAGKSGSPHAPPRAQQQRRRVRARAPALATRGRRWARFGRERLAAVEAPGAIVCSSAHAAGRASASADETRAHQRVCSATRTRLNRCEARQLARLRARGGPVPQARAHHVALPAGR
jgi:hypothetical protein